eukprot:snap_masked-scaffold_1-processed-gene-12.9-mRNA-1 protein AED:1.00 eAED:1.00 QI:0/-1/0/0/-1/1/1/0/481
MYRQSFTAKQIQFGMFRDTSLEAASKKPLIDAIRQTYIQNRKRKNLERARAKQIEMQERQTHILREKMKKIARIKERQAYQMKYLATILLQRVWRTYATWKEECFIMYLENAASVIQRIFRKYMSRKRISLLLIAKKLKSISTIKKTWKKYKATQCLKLFRLEIRKAAINIQRCIRGYFGRQIYFNLFLDMAATEIQKVFRSFNAKLKVLRIRVKLEEYRWEEISRNLMQFEDTESTREELSWRATQKLKLFKKKVIDEKNKRKQQLAKKQGIVMLPWRKKCESLKELVQEQNKRNQELFAEKNRQRKEAEKLIVDRKNRLNKLEEKQMEIRKKMKKRQSPAFQFKLITRSKISEDGPSEQLNILPQINRSNNRKMIIEHIEMVRKREAEKVEAIQNLKKEKLTREKIFTNKQNERRKLQIALFRKKQKEKTLEQKRIGDQEEARLQHERQEQEQKQREEEENRRKRIRKALNREKSRKKR